MLSLPRALRAVAALLCLVPAAAALQRTGQEGPPSLPFPVALFGVHPPEGDAPLTVRFSDNSLGVITSWHWDFGDGTSSKLRNPTKVFEAGVYAITLTVAGPDGRSQRVRPRGVTARSCTLASARANRGFPLERGEEFVPITGDDALGFYCVYSGKAVDTGGPGISNNVGIYVLPLAKGEVLLFGTGYGDANSFVNPSEDAAHDARRVDAILRFCLGRTPERTPLYFATPHGHIDHINSDFIRELRRRRYPIADIAFHSADSNSVRNLPGWTTADRAAFRTLRSQTGECQEELASYASPLGRIWLFLRAGHTAGSLDLVIDVQNDPDNRFVVRGSGESYGSCPIPGVREAIEPHGNALFRAPEPRLFAASPADGSVLGNTTVVLSGSDFRANFAGAPEVLFDGVAASSVRVLDDATLTCVAPPGLPESQIDIQLENHNGRATLTQGFAYRPLPTLTSLAPASAPVSGGTLVTLRGSGFLAHAAGTNVVTFGGAAASAVRVLDDDTLQC
ncbi:MAG: PKD domain-containing protein, partial [Planctomycetes bacterium]|nr:PKD domain-containing protein [Planctomycetota bacterium]